MGLTLEHLGLEGWRLVQAALGGGVGHLHACALPGAGRWRGWGVAPPPGRRTCAPCLPGRLTCHHLDTPRHFPASVVPKALRGSERARPLRGSEPWCVHPRLGPGPSEGCPSGLRSPDARSVCRVGGRVGGVRCAARRSALCLPSAVLKLSGISSLASGVFGEVRCCVFCLMV